MRIELQLEQAEFLRYGFEMNSAAGSRTYRQPPDITWLPVMSSVPPA
ncbi:hypothetical protein [Streptomyces sp. NPDC048516]